MAREGGRRKAPLAAGEKSRSILIKGAIFLLPALIVLGALVVYPIFFTVFRSFFDRTGDAFVGAANYERMFTTPGTLTAIKNNLIWVVFAPTIATALGLIFAVMTERIRWSTAFKVAIFMPMAISFLAAGVIFRLVYEHDPDRGLANAVVSGIVDTFRSPGPYPGATVGNEGWQLSDGALVAPEQIDTGEAVQIAMLSVSPQLVPDDAAAAEAPGAPADSATAIWGVVWLDFTPGGTGERGTIDPQESGLPGMRIEAVQDGEVVGSATAAADGSFVIDGLEPGSYGVRLAASNFREPFGGIPWIGPTLVTPSVIGSFVWIWAGFAMVVIGAGLAAIPRDVLEAARVDGASEWQVFRRVTVPLLMPVLLVVMVTLMINVLKIFDLVLVIPGGAVQDDATVIALEMWRQSFGGGGSDFGLGSALAVFLFVLVIPAMAFNIRRFRLEG